MQASYALLGLTIYTRRKKGCLLCNKCKKLKYHFDQEYLYLSSVYRACNLKRDILQLGHQVIDTLTTHVITRMRCILYNNTRILCVCVCVCVCVCLSVCLSPLRSPGTGGRSAALFTPSWRASPGELHKPLLESIRRRVKEIKALKIFSDITRRCDARVER